MNRAGVGRLLVALRERRGPQYTMADLAAVTRLDAGYISRLERGERVPSLEVIARLAPGYGLTPAELAAVLLGGTPPPPPPPSDPLAAITLALREGPWEPALRTAITTILAASQVEQARCAARYDEAADQLLEAVRGTVATMLLTAGPSHARHWLAAHLARLRASTFPYTPARPAPEPPALPPTTADPG